MPKVSQQYLDERREEILAAARRCFLRDGFHTTSMQDLFEESKLSSGVVYRYFASKEDMIIAIAEENLKDVIATVHSIATQESPTSIGAALAQVVESIRTKHQQDGFAGLAIQVWAEALRNPSLAAQFSELMAQVRTELADVVRQSQEQGDLISDVSPDAVATLLQTMVAGAIVQLALLGDPVLTQLPSTLRALWPQDWSAGGSAGANDDDGV